jgi:hypothetical protein
MAQLGSQAEESNPAGLIGTLLEPQNPWARLRRQGIRRKRPGFEGPSSESLGSVPHGRHMGLGHGGSIGTRLGSCAAPNQAWSSGLRYPWMR